MALYLTEAEVAGCSPRLGLEEGALALMAAADLSSSATRIMPGALLFRAQADSSISAGKRSSPSPTRISSRTRQSKYTYAVVSATNGIVTA